MSSFTGALLDYRLSNTNKGKRVLYQIKKKTAAEIWGARFAWVPADRPFLAPSDFSGNTPRRTFRSEKARGYIGAPYSQALKQHRARRRDGS